MFIKFKILNYWLFLLLVICLILELYVSNSTTEQKTCRKSDISANATYSEESKNQSYAIFKNRKCSNTLRAIVDHIRKKKSKCNSHIRQKIIKNFPVPENHLSFKNNDIAIEATSIHDGTGGARIANTFHAESSFPSSQFDSVINKELDGDSLKTDLNDTSNETFHEDSETRVREQIDQDAKDVDLRNQWLLQQEISTVPNDTDIKLPIESAQEDIPSFREWTEKHLAEKKKERADDNATNVPINSKNHKMRNKNYASLDCGAKLLATNPEAKSTGSLLSASRDEYLLSVCNNKIWFVVELCEAVQLKRIEIANFELFSSSPKEFSLFIADRFPSRDWTLVGQFIAKDEKSIQSFDLRQHHFTKYIKVEFHSHYGKEHFCPISLFRVYGTSEFEVLETVDDNEELETEDIIESDYDANEPIMSDVDDKKRKLEANNLFGSAKEAVMNIVKKAAEVLVINPSKSDGTANGTQLSNATTFENRRKLDSQRQCFTVRYLVLCRDCKEDFFHRLFRIMSCYMDDLNKLLERDVIWKPLIKYKVCLSVGIKSIFLRDQTTTLLTNANYRHNEMYIMYLLPRETIVALCNLVAISENRLKQNITVDETLLLNQTLKRCDNATIKKPTYKTLYQIEESVSAATIDVESPLSTFKIVEHTSGTTQVEGKQSVTSQIRPTKTIVVDGEKLQPQVPALNEFLQPAASIPSSIPVHVPTFPDVAGNEQIKTVVSEDPEILKEIEHPTEMVEDPMSLDSLISELEKTEAQQATSNSAPTATPKPAIQKESVFVRLANRVKALERNMSLSGQYLEELSRRYKKQVEDMQRMLSETAGRETKRSQEVSALAGRISELTTVVEALVAERDSWSYKAIVVGEHSVIIFLEIVIFIMIVCLCRGIPRVEISKRKFSLEWYRGQRVSRATGKSPVMIKRRQSLDDLSVKKLTQQHRRRPSEEAVKVDGGTHQDLLIYETNRSSKAESRRRKRKRKELLLKSNANAINLETGNANVTKKLALNRNNAPLSRSASASEIDEHSWGRHSHTGMNRDGEQLVEQKENLMLQHDKEFSSVFKTATSVRTKRLSNQFNGKSLLSPVYDVSSDQDSSVPTTPVKEKKINGIKKIVKKFF